MTKKVQKEFHKLGYNDQEIKDIYKMFEKINTKETKVNDSGVTIFDDIEDCRIYAARDKSLEKD